MKLKDLKPGTRFQRTQDQSSVPTTFVFRGLVWGIGSWSLDDDPDRTQTLALVSVVFEDGTVSEKRHPTSPETTVIEVQ